MPFLLWRPPEPRVNRGSICDSSLQLRSHSLSHTHPSRPTQLRGEGGGARRTEERERSFLSLSPKRESFPACHMAMSKGTWNQRRRESRSEAISHVRVCVVRAGWRSPVYSYVLRVLCNMYSYSTERKIFRSRFWWTVAGG